MASHASVRRARLVAAGAVALAAGAAALTGCGSASEAPRAASGSTVPTSVRARQAAVHRQVTASLHHLAAATVPYGGIPDYLPTASAPVHHVVTASASHHVLAVQGDEVAVRLATGRASVTAVGPDVPDRFHGTDKPDVPATFTVTVERARGTVPLLRSAFTVTDEQGAVHHPSVSVAGGAPPARAPGGTVTLTVRTRLPIGNGRLRYRPGRAPAVVTWDFDNESD